MADKPLRALRRFCLDCQGGHPPSVAACKDADCLLFAMRRPAGAAADPLADAPCDEEDSFPERPLRVIRRFCLACGGSRTEVRTCDARDACPLWSYRFGVLPATFKRVLARQRRSRSELLLPGLPR